MTTRRYQFKATLLSAVLALAAALTGTPNPATATPITYNLDGTTATFGTGTDTFTGSFTFDPSGPTLDAVDITITGPFCCQGTYTTVSSATSNSITTTRVNGTFTDTLTLTFSNPLGSTPDPLFQEHITQGTFNDTISNVTGTADPTAVPEPASLAILGTALAGLALIRRRRRRKNV